MSEDIHDVVGRTQALSRAIASVCPIDGVSVGDWGDRDTWRIDYSDDATDEERDAADTALAEFDASAPTVPDSVSPYQARMALHSAGLLISVDALMADSQTDPAAKIAWEYATSIERRSPFISALAPALGLSDAQIDDIFVAAAAF